MKNTINAILLGAAILMTAIQPVRSEDTKEDLQALFQKANEYLEQGRYKEAEALYTRILKVDARPAAAWINRGIARCKQGKFTEGVEDFTQALKLVKNAGPVHAKRGAAYFDNREYANALKDFKKALELSPELARDLRPLIADCEQMLGI